MALARQRSRRYRAPIMRGAYRNRIAAVTLCVFDSFKEAAHSGVALNAIEY